MNLRTEFEPLLISPYGLHLDAERAARCWDLTEQNGDTDEGLGGQIARADEWLRLCRRTKHVNRKAGTSYGLKHAVERWHRGLTPSINCYVQNGCFLMAAHRLGFKMLGYAGRYFEGRGRMAWDCHNAWINISRRGMPDPALDDMRRITRLMLAAPTPPC